VRSGRAVTERAKGILMERHGVDEQQAFHLIREESRRTNTKMVDVAMSILASHRLLPGAKESSSSAEYGQPADEGDR
jgi:hypothetical protein